MTTTITLLLALGLPAAPSEPPMRPMSPGLIRRAEEWEAVRRLYQLYPDGLPDRPPPQLALVPRR